MSRKKILWLCSWYPSKIEPYNGDFIQRHALAAALYSDIYVIHVIGDTHRKAASTIIEINQSEKFSEHIVYYKRTSSWVGKIVSYFRWMSLSKQAVRRYIGENGKPDLIHVQVPIKAGIIALWIKKKFKIPYVLTEHWGIYNEVEINNYESKPLIFKLYTKKIFNQAAKFISVSKFLASGVNKLVTKKEYEVVVNTVNSELFYYKDKKKSIFRFIHVSNMVPLKNAEGILLAFAYLIEKNINAQLIMIGDTKPEIRNLATKLDLINTHVFFRGEVSNEKVALEMQESDCLILFSNIENSPCVIGEALCCGLPVITTNVGGVTELVDNENSLLIMPKDEKKLAQAMLQIINNYSNYEQKKIAEQAASRFSYPVIGKKLDQIYSEVISEKC